MGVVALSFHSNPWNKSVHFWSMIRRAMYYFQCKGCEKQFGVNIDGGFELPDVRSCPACKADNGLAMRQCMLTISIQFGSAKRKI